MGCLVPKDVLQRLGGWQLRYLLKSIWIILFYTSCTKDNPILLILDSHGSLISIQAGQKAKVLFCLPFHLTLAIDSSRLTNQFIGMKDWLHNNPGELVRIGHMSQLVKSAILNSMI